MPAEAVRAAEKCCKGGADGKALCDAANALLQCKDTQAIETAYITTSPCWTCVKLLLNTGCKGIVFAEEYSDWLRPYNLWTGNKAGNRRWQLHNTAIQYDTTIQFVPAKK